MTMLMELLRRGSRLDSDSPTPLYQRLQQGIRLAVREGAVGEEQALPSERELATGLGVSRVTVRKAIAGLVEERLLVQRQGAGTFVSPRVEQPLSRLTGFTEDMHARGMSPGLKWLDRSAGTATPQEALALELAPGSLVTRLYRIRTADGKPMCLEHATVPRSVLPDPQSVTNSLYEALERVHLRPVRALQRLRAELFSIEQAHLLGVQPGSACLYIERRSYVADGRPIEFVRSHYRGDSYDFIAELQI
ncbi:MAG: GntR family transcriptional regulator [Proteobacteria bacterium]|nr:GntR family transcriptional regulator [Pseudomonadota bacterium]